MGDEKTKVVLDAMRDVLGVPVQTVPSGVPGVQTIVPATPPEPAAPVVHDNDGKGRPVCGAELSRGDSVGRSGVTCRACAPEPDEAERVAREHLGVTVVTKYTRAAVADLAALLRAAERRGYERGAKEAETLVREQAERNRIGTDSRIELTELARRIHSLTRKP